jgi:hypothetical protein
MEHMEVDGPEENTETDEEEDAVREREGRAEGGDVKGRRGVGSCGRGAADVHLVGAQRTGRIRKRVLGLQPCGQDETLSEGVEGMQRCLRLF